MQTAEKQPFLTYLLWTALVAGSFFIFGLLGLVLAVPPSNAGAVWSPADISLAAVLLLGRRIWPGIFMGNFCISAWAFGFYNAPLIVFLANGCGATISALVGSSLIHRFVGFPNKLIEDKAVISFFLLGGPISCLLPATVAITTMTLNGILSMNQVPVNWFSWWVGDTMGVLIFTPLTLISFGKPRKLWRQRSMSVGVPLAFSFMRVIFFFLYASKLEQDIVRQDFKNLSASLSQALENRINNQIHVIYSLRSFIAGSHHVEKNEFALFSNQPLSHFNELESLSLLKKKQNVGSRPWYTLLFSEYKKDGFDQPLLLQILDNLMIDDPLNLPDTDVSILIRPQSIYFYLAVDQENKNDSDNLGPLSRLIISRVSIKKLVHETFRGLDKEKIVLTISAPGSSADNRIIYSNIDLQNAPPSYRPFSFKHVFTVEGKIWTLEIIPSEAFVSSRHHWTIWSVLIGGFFLPVFWAQPCC